MSDHSRAFLISSDVTGMVVHSYMELWFSLSCILLAALFTDDQVAYVFGLTSYKLLDVESFTITGAGD